MKKPVTLLLIFTMKVKTLLKLTKQLVHPIFYVFDKELKCVYRGRFDGATPKNNVPVTGEELQGALDAILVGQPVNSEQKASIGCNIKWKPVA
ncbi:conserved hypothetical protein [Beggiatoa sp. PS]|nr:conserved hypothetical protein [Beggiatoa sp. PS]